MSQAELSSLTVLSNGLRVVHVPAADTAAVFVSLAAKAGRRAEADQENGAAHFLEHLFFDGTVKRPNPLELHNVMAELGAQRNASTYQEYVQYWVKILAEHADVAFDYLSDILLNSKLEEIAKERKVIAQEAAARQDDSTSILYRQRLGTMFPGQRLGASIFDDIQNFDAMTREALLAYRERNYGARNLILTVGGAISREQTLDLAKKYFLDVASGEPVIFEQAQAEPEQTIHLTTMPLRQSKLSISFAAYPSPDPRTNGAKLLVQLLGRGSSSRIYHCLRTELHLAYRVAAQLETFTDSGLFEIEAFIDEKNLQLVISEIMAQLQLLLDYGITESELMKAKNMLISQKLFALESLEAKVFRAQGLILNNRELENIDDEIQVIRDFTRADIEAIARDIFADKPKVDVLTNTTVEIQIPDLKQPKK